MFNVLCFFCADAALVTTENYECGGPNVINPNKPYFGRYIYTTLYHPFLESHCMALDSLHDVGIFQGTAIFAELFRRHLLRTVLHSNNSGNVKWDSCMSTIVCLMCGKN